MVTAAMNRQRPQALGLLGTMFPPFLKIAASRRANGFTSMEGSLNKNKNVYWVRTRGRVVAGSKYYLNKNKNETR